MKYHILLALEVEALPADLGGAARKGFDKLAEQFNSDQPITLHLLPQDGSPEAVLQKKILACCFKADSKPKF
jgi:hypothetical protein